MAFVTISRLCSRRILGVQSCYLKPNLKPILAVNASTVHQPLKIEDHDLRNIKLNRPMSPHISIYKFEMPAILSITHRITGIALSVYATGFGASALLMSHDFSHYISAIEAMHFSTPTILIAKFILAFPLSYHTCNGARHLLWDTGSYLNKNAVITTGSAMLAATLLTTAIIMFC